MTTANRNFAAFLLDLFYQAALLLVKCYLKDPASQVTKSVKTPFFTFQKKKRAFQGAELGQATQKRSEQKIQEHEDGTTKSLTLVLKRLRCRTFPGPCAAHLVCHQPIRSPQIWHSGILQRVLYKLNNQCWTQSAMQVLLSCLCFLLGFALIQQKITVSERSVSILWIQVRYAA